MNRLYLRPANDGVFELTDELGRVVAQSRNRKALLAHAQGLLGAEYLTETDEGHGRGLLLTRRVAHRGVMADEFELREQIRKLREGE